MSGRSPSVDTGQSWVYLCGASIIMFLWAGLPKALAVLLPTLRDQFDTYTWPIGMMISLILTMRDFSAPVVGALTTADNLRTFALVGGVIGGVSLIASSMANNLLVLVILTSVSGVAYAFLLIPTYTIIGRHFDKYFPLATGVSYAFASIGVMTSAPATQVLLTTYGWRNTLLLLGAFYVHLVVGASLYRTPDTKSRYAALESSTQTTLQELKYPSYISSSDTLSDSSTNSSVSNSSESQPASTKSSRDDDEIYGWMSEPSQPSQSYTLRTFLDQTGLSLFNNRSFITILVMMTSISVTWMGWLVYFVPNCLVKGLTPYQATFLVTAAGFANLIGHLIYVPFVARGIISVRGWIYIAGTLSTVALLVDKFTVTVASIAVSNLSYALGIGIAYPLCDVLVKDAVGADLLAKAYGLRTIMTGGVRLIVGVVVGWIYDTTESYAIGYFLLATIQATGVIALAVNQLLEKL